MLFSPAGPVALVSSSSPIVLFTFSITVTALISVLAMRYAAVSLARRIVATVVACFLLRLLIMRGGLATTGISVITIGSSWLLLLLLFFLFFVMLVVLGSGADTHGFGCSDSKRVPILERISRPRPRPKPDRAIRGSAHHDMPHRMPIKRPYDSLVCSLEEAHLLFLLTDQPVHDAAIPASSTE